MLDTIKKLKEIFEAETGLNKTKKLYYIKRVYDDSLDNINNVDILLYPCLVITDDGQQIQYTMNRKINKTLSVGINYFDISGASKNMQVGSENKNVVGYEKMINDVITILKDNLQVADYWTLLTIDSVVDATMTGASGNVKGKKLILNIQKKCF